MSHALLFGNVGDPLGLAQSPPQVVNAYMRGSAGSQGQIVRFDLGASDGAVTASTNFNQATNPTANVLLATNSHNGVQTTVMYLYGVLMEDVADDAIARVCIRGVVQALGGDTAAAGSALNVGAGSELIVAIDSARVCAVALETLADATLKWVVFNGIEGFAATNDVAA